MNKILKLLVDDFLNKESSAEYKFVLTRYCDAEKAFMASLGEEQKAEYLKLDFITGELGIVEQNELAEYLYAALGWWR